MNLGNRASHSSRTRFATALFRVRIMIFYHSVKFIDVILVIKIFQVDHFSIAMVLTEVARFRQERKQCLHSYPQQKFLPVGPRTNYAAASHVFTPVIANTFDNRFNATVTYTEAFASQSVNVGFTFDGTIERNVSDQDIGLWLQSSHSPEV